MRSTRRPEVSPRRFWRARGHVRTKTVTVSRKPEIAARRQNSSSVEVGELTGRGVQCRRSLVLNGGLRPHPASGRLLIQWCERDAGRSTFASEVAPYRSCKEDDPVADVWTAPSASQNGRSFITVPAAATRRNSAIPSFDRRSRKRSAQWPPFAPRLNGMGALNGFTVPERSKRIADLFP